MPHLLLARAQAASRCAIVTGHWHSVNIGSLIRVNRDMEPVAGTSGGRKTEPYSISARTLMRMVASAHP